MMCLMDVYLHIYKIPRPPYAHMGTVYRGAWAVMLGRGAWLWALRVCGKLVWI